MMTKRSMAFVFSSCTGMVLYPVSAAAREGGAIGAGVFFSETLALITTLIGFLAVVAAIVLAVLLIRTYATSCKNTSCRYHPRSSRTGAVFDFSAIDTPGELLAHPRGTGDALKASGADGAHDALMDVSFLSALFDEDGALRTPAKDVRGQTASGPGGAGVWPDGFEPEEPRGYGSMEFTDDMIPRVLAMLERQRREAAQQQQQQRQQQRQRQQPRGRQEQQKAPGQQTGARRPQVAAGSERERTGQRAAVEWLVTAPASRGRHFRVASPPVDGGGQAAAEKRPSVAPIVLRRPKHARAERKPAFRRVS